MIDILQSFTLLALSGVVIMLQIKVRNLSNPAQVGASVADEHEDTRDELTSYELERLEREDSFDARISQIKEELAKQQSIIKNSGISADELHPLVKNLPHNIIADKHGGIPDIEYAE